MREKALEDEAARETERATKAAAEDQKAKESAAADKEALKISVQRIATLEVLVEVSHARVCGRTTTARRCIIR